MTDTIVTSCFRDEDEAVINLATEISKDLPEDSESGQPSRAPYQIVSHILDVCIGRTLEWGIG
jgi:hypothetical protein